MGSVHRPIRPIVNRQQLAYCQHSTFTLGVCHPQSTIIMEWHSSTAPSRCPASPMAAMPWSAGSARGLQVSISNHKLFLHPYGQAASHSASASGLQTVTLPWAGTVPSPVRNTMSCMPSGTRRGRPVTAGLRLQSAQTTIASPVEAGAIGWLSLSSL